MVDYDESGRVQVEVITARSGGVAGAGGCGSAGVWGRVPAQADSTETSASRGARRASFMARDSTIAASKPPR